MVAASELFRFGVISDVQYCDIDDGTNFEGTEVRKYRGSLDALRDAVAHFNKKSCCLLHNWEI